MVLSNSIEVSVLGNDTDNEVIEYTVYLGTACALFAIGLLGFTLNLLVIILIIKDSENLWTPNNVILLNLVSGDFLVSILGSPLTIASALAGHWYWSYDICLWYAWFMATLGFASIGNLAVMAFERWLLITRPPNSLSLRQAIIFAVGVWIYSICLSSPPFFGWGSFGPEAGNISCSVSWEVHDPESHSDTYIAFIFLFGLIVPDVTIGVSYAMIIITLKKVKERAGSRRRHDAKVVKMVALMVAAFQLAWAPYAILALAAQYFDVVPSSSVAILPAVLAKSSICYNPIIYAGLNTQFATSFKKIFCFRANRGRTSTSQTQNTAQVSLQKLDRSTV